jgi:short subunit dehydrogenase-like uncharacterized protein
MITLFGATGYTGTLVAKALDQAEMPFRIAGRSQDRLQRLSSGLKCKPECLVVDIGYTQSLMDLTRNTKLLINCTGPFTDYGERVARQAAVSGVHYLDTTNELGYVYKLQSYDRLAAKSQAALVPSCAFEVALADCAATFLAESFSPPYDEVRVIYHLPGQFSSRGTRKSALRSLATSWVAYRNGHWVGEAPCSRSIKQSISGQVHTLLSMPSCESAIIPPHLQTDAVTTWMSVSPAAGFFGPIFIPFYARFLRSIAGLWIQQSVRARAPVPRSAQSFQISVSLHKNDKIHSCLITGSAPYQITANIIARAAERVLDPNFSKRGLLPPSSVLGTADFFEAAQSWGVRLEKGAE